MEQNVLPRTVGITICGLRTWRRPSTTTRIPSPRARRCAPAKVAAEGRLWARRGTPASKGLLRARRGTATKVTTAKSRMRSGRRPSAPIVAAAAATATAERCAWAGRATPGELRHRDRLAWDAATMFECLWDGPTVRVVEACVWIVVVRLVGVHVRQWRNGVRIWLELGRRVGRRGGRVPHRTAACLRVEAGSPSAVRWQGDGGVVGVEFWPLNLLVCGRTGVVRINHTSVTVARKGGGNTHCYQIRPTASG
jgi:hypothetical protein